MNQLQTNANTELAKDYIAKRKIPQLFEALITGLMVHKPEDHIEFIVDSLSRYKSENQSLKWDAFISRKGGSTNALAPLKKPTGANAAALNNGHSPQAQQSRQQQQRASSPAVSPLPTNTTDMPRPAKLDAIPTGKRNESTQQQQSDERPQSPTPDQQAQRHVEDRQLDQEDKTKKKLLKGKPIIFVGGGPGSGKGTQCEKIIEKFGFTHLSAGDLIRAATEDSTTERGKRFNEIMSQGKLISTEDILGLLKDAVYERADQASGFLIDGFPRRVDQGIQFEKEVAECDVLFYFDVPDEIMTERLIKRGETSGRIDDNQETITKRLVTFHEQTTPILGYYGKQGKLVTIEANREPDQVFADVSEALERLVEQHQVGKRTETLS